MNGEIAPGAKPNALNRSVQFVKETMVELKKCEWPIKREKTIPFSERIRDLVDSTIVVVVCMFLLAVFIGGIDFLLSRMIQLILK